MIFFSLFAAILLTPQEAELSAQLPAIFAKSAAHYRALEADATAQMWDEKRRARIPQGWLKWKNGTGGLDMRDIYWWTSGHFPGSLWYLYEATGDAHLRERAVAWTEILKPVATYAESHDVGFMMYCSYGNARRILKTDKYDALLVQTAETLSRRFQPELGLLRSWGDIAEKEHFLVIPDNLMNLELLEFAAKCTANQRFAEIARSHASVTMKNHFRSDGGTYHVLDYDQRPGFVGQVQEIRRGQGRSCRTAWSRGQSWAIYGYSMMYRESGNPDYLDFARKVADYAMNHPNMPKDGIPYWDYGAPGEERDTSAASVMASGLLELAELLGEEEGARYRAFAVRQLLSLASPDYFSQGDEVGHFLLKHGVGNKPEGTEIDSPLNYGDYYFLEALLRFRRFEESVISESEILERNKIRTYEKMRSLNIPLREVERNYENVSCFATNDHVTIRGMSASNLYEFVYLNGTPDFAATIIETNRMGVGLYALYYDDGSPNRFIQIPSGLHLKFHRNGLLQEYVSISNGCWCGLCCVFDEKGNVTFSKRYLTPQPVRIVK